MRLDPRIPARRASGFTLIEVMIVVVIIGILARIAYPAYMESVAKGRRAQATTQMFAAQQFMERWYSENYDYTKNAANTSVNATDQFPARFAKVPRDGAQYYTITVENLATNTYTLKATPLTGSAMAGDKCGTFTLDNNGKKDLVGATADLSTCWR